MDEQANAGESRRRGAPGIGPLVLAGLGGALIVYLCEPGVGHRRRARLISRGGALLRRGRRRARRLGRRGTRTLTGQWGRFTRPGHSEEPADAVTLTQRVESELFRDPSVPKGRINVNAENGVIVLRGQLDSAEQIERIVARARRVPGVYNVANLMHLPGTPAPNKAAALHASHESETMPHGRPPAG
ncbi:MAG TPA: BON domain-containing protein [Dehalococcoidia bacterium]|nr:BON domain-containing protein [Dehalococcoidia bacterium]